MELPDTRDYVKHVHVACLHEYDGSLPDQVELSSSFSGFDADSKPIILVLHPRWCAKCIRRRAYSISDVYKKRLTTSFLPDKHTDKVRDERAYLKGICS